MIGFKPLAAGPLASGPLLPGFFPWLPLPLPGAGKRYHPPTDYLPEPAWEKRPRKPIRPIWDRAPSGAQPEVHHPSPPPGIPQMPPPGYFPARPRLDYSTFPNFNEHVPPNLAGLGQRMHEARNSSDAMKVLKAVMPRRQLKQPISVAPPPPEPDLRQRLEGVLQELQKPRRARLIRDENGRVSGIEEVGDEPDPVQ